MEDLTLPIPEWFVGDIWDKTGNCFVGSIGAENISSNAFCYRVWLERGENGTLMKGESYDVLTASAPDTHEFCEFPGLEEGHANVQNWLGEKYQQYLNEKRNELTVSF